MKQNSQQLFLEFLIAENRELKGFIKDLVNKIVGIKDKPYIPKTLDEISNVMMHPNYGGTINLSNLGMKEAMNKANEAINPIKESESLIDKLKAETPEEKKEKEEAKRYLPNIYGMG